MAKQKKQQLLSPEEYIRQKARKLPIDSCWCNSDWKEYGVTNVFVVRRHANGNSTVGFFLVDTFCLGLKKSMYEFNVPDETWQHLIDEASFPMEKISYEEAHNLIFGAIAFAEEAGIKPHKSWAITQYLLEEDNDDIPLIEYEFGKDGKYFLIAHTTLEMNTYLPVLRKHLKPNEYDFIVRSDEDDNDEDEDEMDGELHQRVEELLGSMTDEEREKFIRGLESMASQRDNYPLEEYSYEPPLSMYPEKLELLHPELEELFYGDTDFRTIGAEFRQKMNDLPLEEFRKDMEHIIMYEIGTFRRGEEDKRYRGKYNNSVMLAVIVLGEIGNPESLPVVLEVCKQNDDFNEYYFGDMAPDICTPVVYLLGRNRLDLLWDYLMVPGLCTFLRLDVVYSVVLVARQEPERRDEVLDFFRKLLAFYTENLPVRKAVDGNVAGMTVVALEEICAVELLPEIKKMYDTGLVDEMCAGSYDTVEEDIHQAKGYSGFDYRFTMDEHFKRLQELSE